MKIETAIKYANDIAARIQSVNGLLATPLCGNEAVRIRRVWIFGSTVKGSANPNDLDVLIDMSVAGRHFTRRTMPVDKQYLRTYGMKITYCSEWYALKWLTKGMRNVSRHRLSDDQAELDVKVLLYPRNDFNDWVIGQRD